MSDGSDENLRSSQQRSVPARGRPRTRLTRFERKILLAILAVGILPLATMLLLGRTVVQETFEVGVNARVREQLTGALGLYRTYFEVLRHDAANSADAVAHHHELYEALGDGSLADVEAYFAAALTTHRSLAAVRLVDSSGRVLVERENPTRLDHTRFRRLEQSRSLVIARRRSADTSPPPRRYDVALTFVAPEEIFSDYQTAGEVEATYARLEAGSDLLSGIYLWTYLVFVLAVLVSAVAVAIVISRRVTRRVAELARAARAVGLGEENIRVPVRSDDEIGDLTAAFNQMVEDLSDSRMRIEYLQRIGAWQQFARRLAHEIKNPLTPIQLAVQEAEQAYQGDDERFARTLSSAREIVEEEVATLRRLVSEFSHFAKLPEAKLEPADLVDFVRDAEAGLRMGIDGELTSRPDHNITLSTVLPSRAVPVALDAMMFKRVLDNLVRNAAQAILDAGTGSLVSVEVRVSSGRALLRVKDDGPGLPETDSRVATSDGPPSTESRGAPARGRDEGNLFDPYYTTKRYGTGLGLAIAKKVVLEHGGSIIGADRTDERGAVFEVSLPILED